MLELITVGETMVLFAPAMTGPLRYVSSFTKHIAGAESNVAIGLAKLGHTVGFASKVGDDEFGAFIKREIQGEGVDVSQLLVESTRPTGLMFKQITSGDQTEVIYYRENSAASALSFDELSLDYFSQAKILHISGIMPLLSDISEATVKHLVAFARQNQILFSFDPNIRLKLASPEKTKRVLLPLLQQSDIVLLGDSEAKILLDTEKPDEIIEILQGFGAQRIALKLGSKGSIVADHKTVLEIPPYPTISVDSVGAGDAFNAGFLSGLLQGKSLEVCGKMGNGMGSIAVSVPGDIEGLADRAQLKALIYEKNIVLR